MLLPHLPLRARTFAAAFPALPVVLSSVALFAQEDDVPTLPEHARASRAAALHGIAAGQAAGKPQSFTVDGLPGSLKDLDYDGLRSIRMQREARIWSGADVGFELEPLHLGGIYRTRVELGILTPDSAQSGGDGPPWHEVVYDPAHYELPEGVEALPPGTGFSGLRLYAPQRRPDELSEFLVFQGASYFRAVGRDHAFGASARALSLGTAEPTGEEFPAFTRILVEEPEATDGSITLHALLQSTSLTGVWTIRATPGEETVMEIDATLYPRTDLEHVGFAPLTSMFLFAEGIGRRFDDFRSAVHDSDGLQIVTGAGERLWRPLTNPRNLQMSAFVDESPRGFGLAQRRRGFEAYGDVEARYDLRPTVWVEPIGKAWGKGAVVLVEIPTEGEFNDNVVAFWRPDEKPRAGEPLRLQYRLRWSSGAPDETALGRVLDTRTGRAPNDGARLVSVDFGGLPADVTRDSVRVVSTATGGGKFDSPRVERLPGPEGRLRVVQAFQAPEGDAVSDLTLQLVDAETGEALSEKWLYRWTR